MRIAVGLTPVYLAALIFLFETVREPSFFFQVFGTPSVAEEIATASGTAEQHAADAGAAPVTASGDDIGQHVSAADTADASSALHRAKAAGSLAAAAHTRPTASRGKSATDLVDVEIEKSATDLAKRTIPEVAVTTATEAAGPLASTHPPVPDRISQAADLSHPDPRTDLASAAAAPIDPEAAAAAEEALRLSRGDRREVQRRLRFAEFDPQLVDGIFGPATRGAIAAWQEKAGLPATGYVDEVAMALLVEDTAGEYRAWRSAERARARQEKEAQSAVVVSSAQPWPSKVRPSECRRLASGEIAFGGGVDCNFRAFSENFKRDFKDLKGSLRDLWD